MRSTSEAIARRKSADDAFLATDPDRRGRGDSAATSPDPRAPQAARREAGAPGGNTEITLRAIRARRWNARARSRCRRWTRSRRAPPGLPVGLQPLPVLWRKVQAGLSAGACNRRRCAAIVEREEEIEAFRAREYWTVEAEARTRPRRSPRSSRSWTARRSSSSPSLNARPRPRTAPRHRRWPRAVRCTSPTWPRKGTAAPPGAAVHHSPCSRKPRASSDYHAQDHAGRAEAVSRRGAGRRRHRRPDQLHAYVTSVNLSWKRWASCAT